MDNESRIYNCYSDSNSASSATCPRANPLSIETSCILELDGAFFLLFEVEADVPNVDLETVIVLGISRELATALLRAGICRCAITDTIPTPCDEVEFKCILAIGNNVFRVFEVENEEERLVLVRTTAEDALRLVQQGACI